MEVTQALKRLFSDNSKGNAEIIATTISMSFTLVIMIVGYIVTKQSIAAEVSLEATDRADEFNSVAALNTLYRYEDNHENLIEYNKPPVGTAVEEDELESKLKESLSYLKDDSVNGEEGEYRIEVDTPASGDDIEIDESSDGFLFSSSAFVASPMKEEVVVEVESSAK
jgi:hypothetical protein